ncbi:MAG: prepilin-type N-terminal cleavage/methylation domain-containing protein [Azoarcus sp.]|jgi:type IV pilus assembly protein PilW|nr:prepilin-type N-terminal cleavage/methylation domain-containing protein [Azoarcus sp.]
MNIRATAFPRRRRCAGMTLIELMISMALGLLVIIAATSALVADRQTSRDTEALARIQENARIAFDFMRRSLREVGGTPCGTEVGEIDIKSGSGWYATGTYRDLVLEGTKDAGFAGTSASIKKTDNSNFTVTYASGSGDSLRILTLASDAGSGGMSQIISQSGGTLVLQSIYGFNPDDLMLACDLSDGTIFTQGTFTPSPTASMPYRGTFSSPNFPDTFTFNLVNAWFAMLQPEVWFIGANERGGKSLYRIIGNGSNSNARADEIAADAVKMQISYLVPDKSAYLDANSISTDEWPDVVAVRILLTLRNDSTLATGYVERTLAHTVALRNRQPPQPPPP